MRESFKQKQFESSFLRVWKETIFVWSNFESKLKLEKNDWKHSKIEKKLRSKIEEEKEKRMKMKKSEKKDKFFKNRERKKESKYKNFFEGKKFLEMSFTCSPLQ